MAVRVRGLREVPLERLLFVVVLGCSLLLLSVVMLRSEQADGVTKAAPRTFRDGFIVAEQSDVRRAESNETLVEKKTNAVGTQVHVEQQGEHTMTKIKTEDGDEITIKRAAKSNKITTISAHEDGKITIENKDGKAARATEEADDGQREGEKKGGGIQDATALLVDENDTLAVETNQQRRIDDEENAKKNKKVTVVELGRSLTKVSVQSVEEEGDSTATRR